MDRSENVQFGKDSEDGIYIPAAACSRKMLSHLFELAHVNSTDSSN
jgi:hypothetical protein